MNTIKDIFTKIYIQNKHSIDNNTINQWKSSQSVSGLGSDVENNKNLIEELPYILNKYNVKRLLDIPCGDFNWMKEVKLDGIEYTGADIVSELIESNKQKYPNVNFKNINLISDEIPDCDLIMIRDCLIHLSNNSVFKILENIKRSNIKYILTTLFTNENNVDIIDGGYRRINLLTHPFSLIPIMMFNEISGEPYTKNKYLAMFRKEDL